MPTFNCRDIRCLITSSCCHSSEKRKKSTSEDSTSCQSYAQPRCHTYFTNISSTTDLYAATITIGNKRYGKLSYKDQYKHIVRAIKKTYPFRGSTKYVFHFELQSNGNLHAHGVVSSPYQATFIEGLSHFGRRNSHSKSYEKIKHTDPYLLYINKSNVLPCINNVSKKDIKQSMALKVSLDTVSEA